ncbi:MAG TPA: hypothetical protein ENK77_03520 [Epsilonproteobacteria bacterium]|nr:hypothetical protein [Campylobacterota bacterium]
MAFLVIVEFIALVVLWRGKLRLKEELAHLNHKCNQMKIAVAHSQVHADKHREQIDTLDTYVRLMQMHRSGESAAVISERLKIPLNKVEMTLKLERMKKHGAQ